MYNNGTRDGATSSVHEYMLDEVNKTATHVWSWEPATSVPAWHRGNAQRLPNGNTVISWGGASAPYEIPAVTEVNPAGDVVFELYFDYQLMLIRISFLLRVTAHSDSLIRRPPRQFRKGMHLSDTGLMKPLEIPA